MSLITRLRKRTRAWARRRHRVDADPLTIPTRRVYILPTRLGLMYTGMLLLMFLGAMNYSNNLALGLTFILASVGLVAMHHCQRNLAGLRVGSAITHPVFAGQIAHFVIAIESDSKNSRHEIVAEVDGSIAAPLSIAPASRGIATVDLQSERRGRLALDHLQVSTHYPFGLFRAWTHVYIPMTCIVYPKPAERSETPPLMQTDIGGAHDSQRGDEDFSGLRTFQPGDSPRRIAWKAYARGQDLQVKQYSGTAVISHVLDWDSLSGKNTESRLATMCRWIEDAHAAGRAYGLRMPGVDIAANVGMAHRQRCLTLLALFEL